MPELICIKTFQNRFEAEVIKSVLAANGIQTFIISGVGAIYENYLLDGIKVLVSNKDVIDV